MQQLAKWHDTIFGLIVFLIAELALAILLAKVALNSGNAWEWLLVLILLAGCAQNFFKLMNLCIHGNKHKTS